MNVTVEIPDEFAGQIVIEGQEPARFALEAIALHGYRSDRLTESDIRQLVGFETRMEVHGFLKEHGAFLPHTIEELEHDREVARHVTQRAQGDLHSDPASKRLAG